MSADYNRMSPEFALVQILGSVPAIASPDGGDPKVAVMQPKKDWRAPFLFYVPTLDSEEAALDGPTGLQSFSAAVHCVAGTHRGLQLLCLRVRNAIFESRGVVYETPETDPDEGPKGVILIENTSIEQSSPDLMETEVGLYRRIYTVRIDYQTEEVLEENEN